MLSVCALLLPFASIEALQLLAAHLQWLLHLQHLTPPHAATHPARLIRPSYHCFCQK
jgi:hypothetical protein